MPANYKQTRFKYWVMVNMSYQNSELRVKRVMSDITVINYSKTEKISVKNREIWVDQEN